jgi:acetyltransferase-like isoleucine patch superfamily enzyme
MTDKRSHLEHDWYGAGIPGNVSLEDDVYLDSSYAFSRFISTEPTGLALGRACGAYDRATFVVGPRGKVSVGSFTCLNGVYLICHQRIEIGRHCLFAWGAVITDSWLDPPTTVASRRSAMEAAAKHPQRWMPEAAPSRPVLIEDNVWVGFDSIVLPGVTLGRGCIIGCKSVVDRDVPPYAVFVGNPGKVVRHLDADDSPEARQLAFQEHLRVQR